MDSDANIVIAADMTKLLSAESFIAARIGPAVSKEVLQDPDAVADFRAVVDTLCNNTRIHFQPPKRMPSELGPIVNLWSRLASPQSIVMSSPVGGNPGAGSIVGELATRNSFVDYIKRPEIARRVIRWVAFQVSEPRLQDLFWANNDVGNLIESHEILNAEGMSAGKSIVDQLEDWRIDTLGFARPQLDLHSWTNETFTLAYAFWAYRKGVRYAQSLDDRHAYAVHWLRLHAVKWFHGNAFDGSTPAPVPVPWGCLLEELFATLPSNVRLSEFESVLNRLRDYNASEFEKASTPTERRKFLQNGLREAVESVRPQQKLPSVLIDALEKVAEVLVEAQVKSKGLPTEGADKMAGLAIRLLLRHLPIDGARSHVRLLMSRKRSCLERFIETGHQ